MSRFHVGQRVRVNYPPNKQTHGKETTVVALNVAGRTLGRNYVGNLIAIYNPSPFANGQYVYEDHELVPIADHGREVIAWADCVWKPQHLRSRVEA